MPSELRYSTHSISEDDIAAVVGVLRSDWLTQGKAVPAFEEALAEYVGAKYAVAVSSGTAALHLALTGLALSTGSSMVLTSPLSFVATANAALLAGHEVDFCDVDPRTGLIDWHRTVSRTGRRFQIAVPVHYAGRCCNLEALQGPTIIEDACHAFGATCFDGCGKVGNCAHSLAACFSFHPVKPITTGEGGAITTNDEGFAELMRVLRSHGRHVGGQMVELGFNYRMTDIQAALGRSQLERCDEMRERRRELVAEYQKQLLDHGVSPCDDDARNAWHLFPVRIRYNGARDRVKAALNAQGIMAQVHYHPIIPLQPYYVERFSYRSGEFPDAEQFAAEELSLPLHAKMVKRDVTRVVDALREAL